MPPCVGKIEALSVYYYMGNNYDHARITAVDSLVCLKSNFDRPTFTLLHHLETTIYDTIVKAVLLITYVIGL